MIYIGIDPGQDGGFAIIRNDSITCQAWDGGCFVDAIRKAKQEMKHVLDTVVVVEKVGAMPKQGVSSTFTFGKSAGFIEGVLTALEMPHQLVPPKEWKKEFGLNSDKAKSIEVCKRLFPNVNLKRTERCKKDHDGMAEALLMAEYGRRLYGRGKE